MDIQKEYDKLFPMTAWSDEEFKNGSEPHYPASRLPGKGLNTKEPLDMPKLLSSGLGGEDEIRTRGRITPTTV